VDLKLMTTVFPRTTIGAFTLRYRLFHVDVLNRVRLRLKATSLPLKALPSAHLTPDRTTTVYCFGPVNLADVASQLM